MITLALSYYTEIVELQEDSTSFFFPFFFLFVIFFFPIFCFHLYWGCKLFVEAVPGFPFSSSGCLHHFVRIGVPGAIRRSRMIGIISSFWPSNCSYF